uniref:Polycystin-1-like protein 1 n=1 Tax=Denticeps clupeoides TaxID=299321 RepID=A0AAY4A191_9TELE
MTITQLPFNILRFLMHLCFLMRSWQQYFTLRSPLLPFNLAVKIYSDKQVCGTGTDITFRAVTEEPDLLHFLWHFGDGPAIKTSLRTITKKYSVPNRYRVTVTAFSEGRSISSEVFFVVVQRPVHLNRLQFRPSVLINTSVDFHCRLDAGTNATYLWSFGDETVELGRSGTQHVYGREGEFAVEVTVFNLVSSAFLRGRIFVVHEPCQPPPVKNMGPKKIQVHRSQAVSLGVTYEADIDCNTSQGLLYSWQLRDPRGKKVLLPAVETHRQNIELPKFFLHYGIYTAIARVRVLGSVVYSNYTVEVEVVPQDPVSVINGATNVFINRHNTAVIALNGERSHDPDYPDDSLSYNWHCRPVSRVKGPCFVEAVQTSQSRILFPASVLHPGFDQFKFTLTMFLHGVILLISVQVYCDGCWGNAVNWNEQFTVISLCEDCSTSAPGPVLYSWKLYVVNASGKANFRVPFCSTVDMSGPSRVLSRHSSSAPDPPDSAQSSDSQPQPTARTEESTSSTSTPHTATSAAGPPDASFPLMGSVREKHVDSTRMNSGSRQTVLGKSQLFFTSREAPRGIRCQIQPSKGFEIHTDFSVFCASGKEDYLYEYSYSVGDDPPRVLYEGTDFQHYFRLPAGDPEAHFKVTVYTLIKNRFGTWSKSCSATVEVLPSVRMNESSSKNPDEELNTSHHSVSTSLMALKTLRYRKFQNTVHSVGSTNIQVPRGLEPYISHRQSNDLCIIAQFRHFKKKLHIWGGMVRFIYGVSEFTLLRSRLNLHRFNITSEHHQQALRITVAFTPPGSKAFPVMLLFRMFEQPSPTSYSIKRIHQWEGNTVSIFIPPLSHLKDAGAGYFMLLNADYNRNLRNKYISPAVNYTLNVELSQCLSWEGVREWTPDGCTPVPGLSSFHINCRYHIRLGCLHILLTNSLCSHYKSVMVYYVMALSLAVYAVLMIVCKRADVGSQRRKAFYLLPDNNPADQQCYSITVDTGLRSAADMSAKVYIVLYGDDGVSETRELSFPAGKLFTRNSRSTFVLSTPVSLGPIWKVHLWHDNGGPCPSWYLSHVLVKDLVRGSSWFFLAQCWLAVDEDDGKVERKLVPCKSGLGFRKLLYMKMTEYLEDHHPWLSVYSGPPDGVLTRVQRLTVCLLLLHGYMGPLWFYLVEMTRDCFFFFIYITLSLLPVEMLLFLLFYFCQVTLRRTQSNIIVQHTDRWTKLCLKMDMGVHAVVLSLLLFVTCGKTTDKFNLNKAIRTEFTRGPNSPFQSVRSPEVWWNWTFTTLLDGLYWEHGNSSTANKANALRGTCILIGEPIFTKIEASNNLPEQDICPISVAEVRLRELYSAHWFGRSTRAAAVQFTLYNPPSNLFATVSILVEQLPTGGLWSSAFVESTRLYSDISALHYINMTSELLFLVVTLLQLYVQICSVCQKGFNVYWKDIRNWLEVTIICLTLLYYVGYMYNFTLKVDTIDSLLRENFKKFVDLEFVFTTALLGVILFLTLVKFLFIFQMNKTMAYFVATFKNVSSKFFWSMVNNHRPAYYYLLIL